jgi:hypothetical protein
MKTTTEKNFTVSFVDANNARKNVRIEITYRNGYKELSICDDNGQGEFKPANDAQKELQTIWDTWHLNGMHAGTIEQEEAFTPDNWKKFHELTNIQTIVWNEFFEARKEELRPLLERDWKGKYNVDDYFNSQEGKNNIAEDIFHQANAKVKQIREASETDYEKRCYLLKFLNLFVVEHPETKQPFKYGHGWLLRELPANIEEVIEEVIEAIEQAEDERKGEPLTKLSDSDLCKVIAENKGFDFEVMDTDEDNQVQKLAAIARMFDLSENDLNDIEIDFDNYTANVQGIEYYFGTDSEMDEKATDYVKDSLWAFNSSFLASETELPSEVFQALSEKYESGNDAILRIVEKTCGLESFVGAALRADGRAHFLNNYDGEEQEATVNNETYYAYRNG